jgi:DNA-binding NarL/FixJ family response regulator
MSITVFLADDHAIVRDGLRFLLDAQPDIQVIGDAGTGQEAIEKVPELCPNVVVMDIAMPDVNGIEATRRIAEICPSAHSIILSMHSTSEHVFRALQAGARGYLLKECAGAEVADAVRTVHAGHRYLSTAISDTLIDEYVRQRQSAGPKGPLERLSPREWEVLQLIVDGASNDEIADVLCLSPKTIVTYRSRLMQKLGIGDLPSLVKFAIQHGLTSLE